MTPVERPVDLVSTPYAGHLHPILGIARELAGRGVPVRVITASFGADDVRAAGFEPHLIGVGAESEILQIANTGAPIRSNPVRLAQQLRRQLAVADAVRGELARLYAEAPPALALVDSVMPFAGVLAQQHGARWWTVGTSPCAIEAVDGPPAYVAGLRPGGRLADARDAVLRRQVRLFKQAMFGLNRPVARRMGVSGVYRADGSESVYSDDRVFALGLADFEFAHRFRGPVELVGPVRFTPPRDVDPGAELLTGLEQRPGPRVLVTLGTHIPHAKAAMAEQVERAAAALPHVSFVFTGGAAAGQPEQPRANLLRVPWLSYDRLGLFDLVVHHGGSGVVGAVMRAGLPAIVHPVDYDQFDMAARLEVAGLAREVRAMAAIPRAVADELQRPSTDPAAIRRFQQLAHDHRGEVAIADAVVEALGTGHR